MQIQIFINRVSFQRGEDKDINLKCRFPKGIPIIVIQNSGPKPKCVRAIQILPKKYPDNIKNTSNTSPGNILLFIINFQTKRCKRSKTDLKTQYPKGNTNNGRAKNESAKHIFQKDDKSPEYNSNNMTNQAHSLPVVSFSSAPFNALSDKNSYNF